MREIKFRIYFNFFDDGYMDFPHFIKNGGKTIIYDGDEYEVGEEIKLMQYSGLKDIAGYEIYEGDIVKDVSDGTIGHVGYSDGGYVIVYDDIMEKLNADESAYLEVIGNIWEDKK